MAREGEALCIVEVKRRIAEGGGSPEEGLTTDKIRRLTNLARAYAKGKGISESDLRIDAVAVDERSGKREFRLYRNVTSG